MAAKDIVFFEEKIPKPLYKYSDNITIKFKDPPQYKQQYKYLLNKEILKEEGNKKIETNSLSSLIINDYTDYKYWSKTLWMCIHIIGKSFDINRTLNDVENCSEMMIKAFICFFTSLSVLLPKKEARESITEFMKQVDPMKYLLSNDALFWTFKLHCYVNEKSKGQKMDISIYDKMCVIYTPERIDKDTWGRIFWFVIHFLSRCLSIKTNREEQKAFKSLMVCMKCLLPCGECRKHLNEHLKDFNIDKYLHTMDTTFEWGVKLHNKVNISTKKSIYSLEQARKDYLLSPVPTYRGLL